MSLSSICIDSFGFLFLERIFKPVSSADTHDTTDCLSQSFPSIMYVIPSPDSTAAEIHQMLF